MRICFVSGIVVDVDWLVELKALRDQHGYEIAAVVASDEGPTGDRLRAWDIPYHVRRLDLGRDRAAIYDAILDLARLFRREGYDVVQGHDFNSAVLARAAAWVADVPVRATRVLGTVHLEAPLSRVLEQATCWMNTLLLGVDYTLSQYRSMGVPPARLAWIASSVDPTKFEVGAGRGAYLRQAFGFSEDSALVGLVGHFYPRLAPSPWTPELMYGRCAKGHEDLLRAAPEILEALPHVRFVMLGGGFGAEGRAHLEEMKDLAITLGVSDRVVFAGAHPDMPAVLRDLDVCVQPSLTENLARATMEALLMERPVVASRTGGLVDLIEDGVTGLLTPPKDPQRLAAAVVWLLRHPQEGQAMGRAGRQRVLEKASPQGIAGRLAKQYQRVYDQSGGRGRRVVRWYRERLLRQGLRFVFGKLVWATLRFHQPPRSLPEHVNLFLLASGVAEWGPWILGLNLYRRWATGPFGFLSADGSFPRQVVRGASKPSAGSSPTNS